MYIQPANNTLIMNTQLSSKLKYFHLAKKDDIEETDISKSPIKMSHHNTKEQLEECVREEAETIECDECGATGGWYNDVYGKSVHCYMCDGDGWLIQDKNYERRIIKENEKDKIYIRQITEERNKYKKENEELKKENKRVVRRKFGGRWVIV